MRAFGLHSWNGRAAATRGFLDYASIRRLEHGRFSRVTVIHQPEDETFQPFEAEGLTLGGRHTWRFEVQFHAGEGF